MPFSEQQLLELQTAITEVLNGTAANNWERGFLGDMQTKLDRYGRRARLSEKQYRLLMKLTAPYRSADRPSQAKSVGSERRHGSPRNRRRAQGAWPWWSALQVVLFSGLVVGYLGFQAVERFPEYLGPLVPMTAANGIAGTVTHVRDGDTIEVSGVPIRFGSLDCAERGTVRGDRATARMRELVSGLRLECFLNGRSSYDRKIGSCRLPDGRDLAAVMIREGHCGRYW
ncbi:thermonuclease family protein [Pseudoruegeria sp. HB172150]|uniref:thermonuclease family protein n=1 Tax=Pseudoruegeria sp. HB172150 TaxID=2721164 RepID=UPI001C12D5BA|nr:hypothetical protein [Pseudoruegeria sp. HB172150]